jgi:hypothetical protein
MGTSTVISEIELSVTCSFCQAKSADCCFGQLRGGQSCFDNYLNFYGLPKSITRVKFKEGDKNVVYRKSVEK